MLKTNFQTKTDSVADCFWHDQSKGSMIIDDELDDLKLEFDGCNYMQKTFMCIDDKREVSWNSLLIDDGVHVFNDSNEQFPEGIFEDGLPLSFLRDKVLLQGPSIIPATTNLKIKSEYEGILYVMIPSTPTSSFPRPDVLATSLISNDFFKKKHLGQPLTITISDAEHFILESRQKKRIWDLPIHPTSFNAIIVFRGRNSTISHLLP